MKQIFGTLTLSFAALGTMAQTASQMDSYTARAIRAPSAEAGENLGPEKVMRRDATAGECLANLAIYSTIPQLVIGKLQVTGSCVQDFSKPGAASGTFNVACDGSRNLEAAERLFKLGKQLHGQGQAVAPLAADVLALCTTSRTVTPAARLSSSDGLPLLGR